ncbi:MAG: 50S ribosomal protein L9 [Candidatus Aminicenantes bacterium]|nr:50S ribosomal protein L9 [Candidatus Aminicenantes bacterium]
MKIILKQDMENLGRRGDIVDVAPGYGRNYLIPKKLALEVTSSNIKMIEIERKALRKKVEKERMSYQDLIQKLTQTTLSFRRKSGEKDVIFGSVSSSDIKDALHEAGFEIDKKKILLEEPIKRLGNYTVPVKVFHDDMAEVKVEVVKEEEEIKEKKEKKAPEKEAPKEEEVKTEPVPEEVKAAPEKVKTEEVPEEVKKEEVKGGEKESEEKGETGPEEEEKPEKEKPEEDKKGIEEEKSEGKADAPEEKMEEKKEESEGESE